MGTRLKGSVLLIAEGFMSHMGGLRATDVVSMTLSAHLSKGSSTDSIMIPYVTSIMSWPDRLDK